jgi:hypothetical protein
MNRFACAFVAFGFAAAGSTALAAPPPKPKPAMMTEAEMDHVTAGALGDGLVTVVVQDSLNNWNLDIALKLQANVAANVNAGVALVGSASAQQLIGTQTQITGNLS